ncbi:MAG: DUF2298 domain-containing protein [Bellilinea sp.]
MADDSTSSTQHNDNQPRVHPKESRLWIALLILVLAAGAYFRFTGLFWGEYSYLHPDERFLIQVTSHISPVDSFGEYFDTGSSTLNPHNVGDTFFVYGTFPIITTRYLAESIFNQVFWEEILKTGRALSAVMDLTTVLLVYLLGTRLFNRKVGVIGAAFSSFAVMQIQQSHFFTSDSFSATFTTLTLYFAARLATQPLIEAGPIGRDIWYRSESFRNSLWFGAAIGLAMACKINTALMAVLLPGAWFIFIMRHPRARRFELTTIALRNLVIGGFSALLFFRIFQPYAFQGPGFFGIMPNERWIANLRELSAQMGGDVDFPPALQWARRPVTYSFTNMVSWGMGLPMGILAWAGFVWMGFRQARGSWKRSLLVWGWTAIYFVWQSLQGNPTMRYQLPIYPTLALIAGWTLVNLWDEGKRAISLGSPKTGQWLKIGSVVLGVVTLSATFAWAYAFSHIYTRPVTRVEASRWILENVPAPVNLELSTDSGMQTQLLPYNPTLILSSGETIPMAFEAAADGVLTEFQFTSIQDMNQTQDLKTLYVTVYGLDSESRTVGYGFLTDTFQYNDGSLLRWKIPLELPVPVQAGEIYNVELSLESVHTGLGISGAAGAIIQTQSATLQQELPMSIETIRSDSPREIRFKANFSGVLDQVVLPHVLDTASTPEAKSLELSLYDDFGSLDPLANTTIVSDFSATDDPRGKEVVWQLDSLAPLVEGDFYSLRMELIDGEGALGVYGSSLAVETTWDDGIPIRIENYDPYGGIYEGDLNFEMYWDDNADKLARFKAVLDRSDYITISSNRQWGTTTRVPERYPLTTEYYRALIGCPEAGDILYCYRTAEVGSYSGELGFELVQVFHSYPNLGTWEINDQSADEAFTVYDHPNVFIFKKTAEYSPDIVAAILDRVDLSEVVHVTPGKTPGYPANLMLPKDDFSRQSSGGTWAEIFDTQSLVNRYPGVGAVVWYLLFLVLGWLIYPYLRIAMKGLPDQGYPLAKITGLLLITWLVWLAGSNGLAFTRGTIWASTGLLAVIGTGLALWQRKAFQMEIKQRWRYYLSIEVIGLAFFLLFLLIRLGNPDLWHPNFGGEKPMDFAYFNAVLKSTTFPPYNPWYSGSWINYYYYGFVMAAVPTKWLGIVPSVAYNLILPTFFSMVALGAFSFGWNLQQWMKTHRDPGNGGPETGWIPSWAAGLVSAVGMLILGNLGTVRMLWEGVMKLEAPGGIIEGASIIDKISWTFQGLGMYFGGAILPYYPADYYWIPSRAVKGGDAITEFPFFTFLYADPHAHMFALPITLLVLGWSLSLVLGGWHWKIGQRGGTFIPFASSFFLGALALGALRPTNTWDMPTYLGLAIVAVLYSALRTPYLPEKFLPQLPDRYRRWLTALGAVLLLVGLSLLLYQPFQNWYAQGYTKVDLWWGDRTSLMDYFTHWGLFIAIIITWLIHETLDWMEKTPVSGLNKLRPFKSLIIASVFLFGMVILFLVFQQHVPTAWLTLTMAVWALVLLFRPGQAEPKRVVLFMVGTAAVLTLAVEIIVLVGDINRMNTVFKFYLQSWTLFSLSAAAGLYWLLPHIETRWKTGWRNTWTAFVGLLVVFALFYPLIAAPAKIRDRISPEAPNTLDGMAFMQTSEYYDQNGLLDLSQDYRAIRWLQENVEGSPVIAEANTTEYRWGSRFSIYTGLPATIGWNWHQRQQRATLPDTSIWKRIDDVNWFYNTIDPAQAVKFLQKYNVRYIMIGGLERVTYDPSGLAKFALYDGQYWRQVYQDGSTQIYEVIQ